MSKRRKLDFSKYYKNPFYPSEDASLKSAVKFRNNDVELPLKQLLTLRNEQSSKNSPEDEKFIVHWFRKDLRVSNNTSLYHSIKHASENESKLIGLYVISTKFWRNHLESRWKINLIERRLRELSVQLNKLNIPLSIVYFDDINDNTKFHDWFEKLVNERFNSSSVYFNLIYDYDEIKRDSSLFQNTQLKLFTYHDECVVEPFTLKTGKNTEFKKFTPWFKKWNEYLRSKPIEILEISKRLPEWDYSSIKSDNYVLDSSFQLLSLTDFGSTPDDLDDFTKKYQVTDSFIEKKVSDFIKLPKIKLYQEEKSLLSIESTSRLSAYITIGAVSTSEIISKIQKIHNLKTLDSGDSSVQDFIKEIAWRDFYKHVLVSNPFLQFDLPYNFNSLDLQLKNDPSKFEKWCLGKTGYPIIDASMRQLLHTGYLSNRSRMIVSNFLSKDLLIDWRWGMNWFHERLIDGDYSSNHGGWTWVSSTGVDCQPWFRSFNWKRQSEKADPNGEFIKTWCTELKDRDGKSVHESRDGITLVSRDDIMDTYKEVM